MHTPVPHLCPRSRRLARGLSCRPPRCRRRSSRQGSTSVSMRSSVPSVCPPRRVHVLPTGRVAGLSTVAGGNETPRGSGQAVQAKFPQAESNPRPDASETSLGSLIASHPPTGHAPDPEEAGLPTCVPQWAPKGNISKGQGSATTSNCCSNHLQTSCHRVAGGGHRSRGSVSNSGRRFACRPWCHTWEE